MKVWGWLAIASGLLGFVSGIVQAQWQGILYGAVVGPFGVLLLFLERRRHVRSLILSRDLSSMSSNDQQALLVTLRAAICHEGSVKGVRVVERLVREGEFVIGWGDFGESTEYWLYAEMLRRIRRFSDPDPAKVRAAFGTIVERIETGKIQSATDPLF